MSPRVAGTAVTIQRLSGGTWISDTATQVTAAGTYSKPVSPTETTTYRVQVPRANFNAPVTTAARVVTVVPLSEAPTITTSSLVTWTSQPGDLTTPLRVRRLASELNIDVLHGHGAKGGVHARLARFGRRDRVALNTPHGGVLNYKPGTLVGGFFRSIEHAIGAITDAYVFESAFAQRRFHELIGRPPCAEVVIHNGLAPEEFDPLPCDPDAHDFVYVGEFRHIKGADLLVDAVAKLRAGGRQITLTLAGDGEETASLKAQIERLKLGDAVRFIGHVKARYGFSKGRLLVVPSRGDSMPYVVIEAAAAGIPMIAANVGGIPEIFASHTNALFKPSDVDAMANAIAAVVDDRDAMLARARLLRERIFLHFSQKSMVEGIISGYREAFAKH